MSNKTKTCQSLVSRRFRAAGIAALLLAGFGLGGAAAMAQAPAPSHTPYAQAVDSYNKGQFQRAYGTFRDLAQMGHGGAEFMLGVMYFYGRGVPRDTSIASIWFYKSARQGNPAAQLAFGSMFIKGVGVSPSNADAYKWLKLASRCGIGEIVSQAAELLRETTSRMTSDEIADADEAVAGFKPVTTGPLGME